VDFTVLTLFPELIRSFFEHGMISRGIEKNLITGNAVNIRDLSTDRHHTVDDRPYGGGSGMVMKPEPLQAAVLYARKKVPGSRVVLMTPQGRRFNQRKALEFASQNEGLIFICGRYEGIDERIYTRLVDEEISIGDYVLTGGEIGAMTIIDSITRLLPNVLGNKESFKDESHSKKGILEYPQYTKPEILKLGKKEYKVPKILLSGHHKKIQDWKEKNKTKV